jgi:hypothetical protein
VRAAVRGPRQLPRLPAPREHLLRAVRHVRPRTARGGVWLARACLHDGSPALSPAFSTAAALAASAPLAAASAISTAVQLRVHRRCILHKPDQWVEKRGHAHKPMRRR